MSGSVTSKIEAAAALLSHRMFFDLVTPLGKEMRFTTHGFANFDSTSRPSRPRGTLEYIIIIMCALITIPYINVTVGPCT